MRIIDAHVHLGEDLLFTTDDSEEMLLKTMDDHGIAAQVVQPGIVARDQKMAHERIRRFAAANPGRCYGLACFNPLMDEGAYADLVRWTVKDLAEASALSRSAFSARFTELVGEPPLTYLTRWRMLRATRLLKNEVKMETIAEQLGYESEAAFRKAFKREMGIPPAQYRKVG